MIRVIGIPLLGIRLLGIRLLGAIVLLSTGISTALADEGKPSVDFDKGGVIVEVGSFFKGTGVTSGPAGQTGVAALALATDTGLYSFLETPQNQERLAAIEPGSVVRINGKLLEKGALLHITALERASEISLDLDLAGLRSAPGRTVSLKGTNKCQCGLDVADLPHSCTLGHLHHLEAEDGKIYHYLKNDTGAGLFAGKDSHFKAVEVRGRLFPGHYLSIEKAAVN